jgi:uncharacterized protein YqkB
MVSIDVEVDAATGAGISTLHIITMRATQKNKISWPVSIKERG